MFRETVFMIEDVIAKADPNTFRQLPLPKFLISRRDIEQCRDIAAAVRAQGVFALRGAVYRLEVGGKIIEGGCGRAASRYVLMSSIPEILSRYFPLAHNLYVFAHSEDSKILGFDQQHSVYMVTFADGASGLREVAERMPGLSMPQAAKQGVLAALKIIAQPYTWNPWATVRNHAEIRTA